MSHDTIDTAAAADANRMAALLRAMRASEARAYNALLRTYDQQQAVAARTDPAGLLASGDPEREALWVMTICRRAELAAAVAAAAAHDAFWLSVDVEALDRRLSAGSEAVSPHDIDRAGEFAKDAQAYARAARRLAEEVQHWGSARLEAVVRVCGVAGGAAALWAKYDAWLPIAA